MILLHLERFLNSNGFEFKNLVKLQILDLHENQEIGENLVFWIIQTFIKSSDAKTSFETFEDCTQSISKIKQLNYDLTKYLKLPQLTFKSWNLIWNGVKIVKMAVGW